MVCSQPPEPVSVAAFDDPVVIQTPVLQAFSLPQKAL